MNLKSGNNEMFHPKLCNRDFPRWLRYDLMQLIRALNHSAIDIFVFIIKT